MIVKERLLTLDKTIEWDCKDKGIVVLHSLKFQFITSYNYVIPKKFCALPKLISRCVNYVRTFSQHL